MRSRVSIFLIVMLVGLVATAQTSPTLLISQAGGNVLLSWSNGPAGIFSLQTATNLARPIIWNNFTAGGGAGTINNVSASAPQQFFRLAQLMPIFQFNVFYGPDLEVSPAGPMNLTGPVWCNGNIWTSPAGTLTFGSTVTACGQIYYTLNPNDQQANGSSNNVIYLDTTNNPTVNAGPLTLSFGASTGYNPTNMRVFINPPPAAYAPPNYAAAYGSNGIAYLENAVDLIISNTAAGTNNIGNKYVGTNIFVYYQNPNNVPYYLTLISPDYYMITNPGARTTFTTNYVSTGNTNVVYASYSFVTNLVFYDFRESDTVQALQINVGKLNIWLTNTSITGGQQYNYLNNSGSTSKGHGINSIYVYNSVPLTISQLPAVRIFNGAQLPPYGLTVATPQPIYVLGNYNVQTNGSPVNGSAATTNTAYTVPAALMGDAVTVLSPTWLDFYNSSTSLSSRSPSADTVNAALLVGIVPSSTDSGGTKYYSGGLENYLRLLENWSSSVALTYNGSEVAMFPSQYATNFWESPGVYYNVPTRNWGFDANFLQMNRLPPLTPTVVNMISP